MLHDQGQGRGVQLKNSYDDDGLITPEVENKYLYALWRQSGLTKSDFLQQQCSAEWTYDQLQGRLRRHELADVNPIVNPPALLEVPEAIRLDKQDALIVGDLHAPHIDFHLLELAFRVGRKHLDSDAYVIWLGDFTTQDQYSSYTNIVQPPNWGDECAAAKTAFEWSNEFDFYRNVFVAGNHDRRVAKKKGTSHSMNWLIRNAIKPNLHGEVIITELTHVTLESARGEWMLVHPDAYSTYQLKTPDDLAMHYQMHVASAHEHHTACGVSSNSKYQLLNVGGPFTPYTMPHVAMDTSAKRDMVPGFAMIKNGVGYALAKDHTDFGFWLNQ